MSIRKELKGEFSLRKFLGEIEATRVEQVKTMELKLPGLRDLKLNIVPETEGAYGPCSNGMEDSQKIIYCPSEDTLYVSQE